MLGEQETSELLLGRAAALRRAGEIPAARADYHGSPCSPRVGAPGPVGAAAVGVQALGVESGASRNGCIDLLEEARGLLPDDAGTLKAQVLAALAARCTWRGWTTGHGGPAERGCGRDRPRGRRRRDVDAVPSGRPRHHLATRDRPAAPDDRQMVSWAARRHSVNVASSPTSRAISTAAALQPGRPWPVVCPRPGTPRGPAPPVPVPSARPSIVREQPPFFLEQVDAPGWGRHRTPRRVPARPRRHAPLGRVPRPPTLAVTRW